MVLRSRTFRVSMRALADQEALGALMVRPMMVAHDLDISNYGNQQWGAARNAKRLGNWRMGAGRYFLRQQISHMNEALVIIKQISDSAEFRGFVLGCDRQTQKAYERLLKFRSSVDWKRMNRIRNKVGFHYGPEVRSAITETPGAPAPPARGQKKGGQKGVRKPVDVVLLEVGNRHRDRRYDPRELVENDMIVHEIFGLKESDTYKEDKKLNEASRRIHARLHEMQQVFGDFAYNFIRRYARAI